jgi:hypothetical protein
LKKIPTIPSTITCGFDPYNLPCLPSHYSLTPPLSPLNWQFFFNSLLLTTFQPFLPLLSPFPPIASYASSHIDYSKSQPRFIFPRRLRSYYDYCLSFSSKLPYWIKALFGVSYTLIIVPFNYWTPLVLPN